KLSTSQQRSMEQALTDGSLAEARKLLAELAARNADDLMSQGASRDSVQHESRLLLRYEASETAIAVPADATRNDMRCLFEDQHRRQFGFISPEKRIFIATLDAEAWERSSDSANGNRPASDVTESPNAAPTRFFSDGAWHDAPIVRRETLRPGKSLD